MSKPIIPSVAVAACLVATPAFAAIVNVTQNQSGGSDNGTIASITATDNAGANPVTFQPSNLILGTLTAFNDADPRIFVPAGGSVPADRSAVIDNDLNLRDGFGNVNTLTFTFATPVANAAGRADFFIGDFGRSNNDTYRITLNGTTVTVAADTTDANGFSTDPNDEFVTSDFTIDQYTSGVAATTPGALDGQTFTNTNSPSTSAVNFASFDFSAFGVAPGATVSSFSIATTGTGDTTQQLDPMVIGAFGPVSAVPEPTAALAGVVGLGGLLVRRHRRA